MFIIFYYQLNATYVKHIVFNHHYLKASETNKLDMIRTFHYPFGVFDSYAHFFIVF